MGDVNIETVQLRDRSKSTEYWSKNRSITTIRDNTTNIGSEIVTNAGGLEIVAGTSLSDTLPNATSKGNINIIGSKLTSSEDLILTAKNDVTIKSAHDTSLYQSYGRIGKGKNMDNKTSSTTQVGSELSTINNGDINITAGKDNVSNPTSDNATGSINLIASRLKTIDEDVDASNNSSANNGDINLTARKDINILSDLNTNYSYSFASKKGMTVKKSSTDISEVVTNVSSEIISNNDVNITSGNDINIIASKLLGDGSANIIAGKYVDNDSASPTYNTELFNDQANVNILSAKDSVYNYHNSTKTKLSFNVQQAVVGTLIGGVFVGIAAGVKKDKQSTEAGSYKENVVSSNLNFGGDVNIASMKDLTVKSSNTNYQI